MSHIEPFTARDLDKWLTGTCGAALRTQTGGAYRVYELSNGRTVTVPNPGSHSAIPTDAARRIAGQLGKSYSEFRAALGHPIVKAGRRKTATAKSAPSGCSKREVLDRLSELRSLATDVESAVRPGVRDPAFYMRVHEQLVEATQEARRALNEATRTGGQ